jgi:hypothetical protein
MSQSKEAIMAMAETTAQSWESMKHTARTEAKSLVDDFPDFPTMTVSAPVMAEQFCQLDAPTDLQSVLMRQLALSTLTNGFHVTRDHLMLSRRQAGRFGCP